MLADGFNDVRHDPLIFFRLKFCRFIEEIEAEQAIGNAGVSFGERHPMQHADTQRFIVRPDRFCLRWARDRVTGRAMEIQADMDAIFPAQIHRIVNLLECRLVKFCPIVVFNPHPIIQRRADEVEPEFRDPLKVLFVEPVIATVEFVQQIESMPAREFSGRRIGQFICGGCRQMVAHKTGNAQAGADGCRTG